MNTEKLLESTVESAWFCMIEGRFLVGKGTHSKGKVAFARKADCAQVFKLSSYWNAYKIEHKADYPDVTESEWKYDYPKARAAEKDMYKKLLESGKVKFLELIP